MRKRPLCLIAALLLVMIWILPKDVWLKEPDIPSGEKGMITGTVIKREEKEDNQVYYLKNCQYKDSNSIFSVLAYTQKGMSYPIGCELSLYGTIYQLNPAENPGQFDGEFYYQSQGILYTFQTTAVLESNGEYVFRESLVKIREFLAGRIMDVFSERDGGILKAVLLGDKSSLREEDQLLYQKNGISHLLAISGLHISMIGISFYKFLRKCRLTFWEAGIPSGILLFSYGMMTGFGISTIRAVCMFLVLICADIFGRTYDMASAMALAAIIILIKSPLQARQAGFLLSFGAVLGVCFVYPVLQQFFESKKTISKTILFSISLSLITYPVSVHFFYEYPLYSILLNFIVIPCMPIVMIFGTIAALSGCLFVGLGEILGTPAHFVLTFYEILGQGILKLPNAVLSLGCEEPWQLLVYYILLLIALLSLWYGRRRAYALLIPIALVLVTLRFHAPLEFSVLSVGQGDCLYLKLPDDTTCLIDGGSTSVKNIGEYRILPYLKYKGVEKLDYMIFTHLDEDHVNGARELLEKHGMLDRIQIGQVLFPDIANPDDKYMQMWKLVQEKGISSDVLGAGDSFENQEFSVECIYPIAGSNTKDSNNSSIVLLVTYKEFSMLLSGDLGVEGEKELLERGVLKDVDVWKVSHHGSKYSGEISFLKEIMPQLSLISVGKNNYGHPSEELLTRLENIGSQVETTLEKGALLIESDGENFSFWSMR